MNLNAEKLRSLKTDLEDLATHYGDILSLEPSIQKPLEQAVEAAGRRWAVVDGDLNKPKPQPWD